MCVCVCLCRRPDLVKLLLEHGCEPTVMDGFGRTPAAVLLEHWPRVIFPSDNGSDLHYSGVPGAALPDPAHNSDTLLQLCDGARAAIPRGGSDQQHYGSRGGRDMELFRQQVVTWRARSAQCLKLLLTHGLEPNDVADRRRAATLLHIAARHDLVDVIQMVLVTENDAAEKSSNTASQALETCENCKAAEGSGVGSGVESSKRDGEAADPPLASPRQGPRGLAMPGRVKRALTRRVRSAVMRSHDCVAQWMWHQSRKNELCQQSQPDAASGASDEDWAERAGHAPTFSWRGVEEASADSRVVSSCGESRSPVDLEVRNGTAKTPLAVAVDRGSLNAAHCLLAHGADVFTVDFYGRSILHFLSERDVTFDLLLRDVVRQGVDVHAVDKGGNTPLHVAAYMGNVSKVRFLLSVGSSPDKRNLAGKTPLFLALQRRDPSAREIILLFMLSSVLVRTRDQINREPMLLQHEDNAAGQQRLEQLHRTCNTLLRRCVVTTRRCIGLSRLLHMADVSCLPCPAFLQRTIYGEEERSIAEILSI